MNKTLVSIAVAFSLLSPAAFAADDDDGIADKIRDMPAQYKGMGIGAATGALVAGPAGFVAGGLLGTLLGWNTALQDENTEHAVALAQTRRQLAEAEQAREDSAQELASAAPVLPETDTTRMTGNTLEYSVNRTDIPGSDVQLDVFFLSGSVDLEPYFAARLQSVAVLLDNVTGLDVHLDGYSDRRGSEAANLALAEQRLDAVRKVLVDAGVDTQRIHSHAKGEQAFVSEAGNLEAYTFDRRVVVRFEPAALPDEKPLAAIDPAATF